MNPQCLNRRRIPLGFFAILISLDVTVRLLEKMAVLGPTIDRHSGFVLTLLKQPWWWLGLGLGPFQLWVWMRILARTELSVAYPLLSMGYPLTMAAAWLVFHEQLSWQVWLGALFITVGVAIVGSATQTSARPLRVSSRTPEPARAA